MPNLSNEIPTEQRTPVIAAPTASNMAGEDEVDLRHLIDLLLSGKWIILAATVIITAIATGYAFLTAPTYEADGLVQVEQDQNGSSSSDLSNISSLLLGTPVQTEAEIQLLNSRMVLDQVVDKLNLLVQASPRLFPIIGGAYFRANQNAEAPLSVPSFLRRYAWGGEVIDVPTFDVPASDVDQQFFVKATKSGFELIDEDGNKILDGAVGKSVSVPYLDGKITIFIRALKAQPGTEFYLTRYTLQDVLLSLSKNLTVAEQGKQSGVISISFNGPTPSFVSQVVDAIEDAYLRQNVERRSAQAQQSLDFLEKQIPKLKERVDVAQQNLKAYQLQHGSVDVTEETSIVLKDSVDLEAQRLTLDQQREEALQRFTPEHPFVRGIDEKLKSIEAAEQKLKMKTDKLPTTQQEILSLTRDLDVANQLYTAMLNSVQQLQVAKAGTVGNVRIVDYALSPRLPAAPKKTLIVALGLLLGLFAGCVYVLVQRALLRGVDDPAEIENHLGLAAYATIPYSQLQKQLALRAERGEAAGHLLSTISGSDVAVEALRSLRNSLHFLMLESSNNVVMLTGPSPGIGKSFVAANLGALLAQSGKPTVLVDADLRLGHLHKYAGLPVSPGVSEFVAGGAAATDVVRPVPGIDRLSIVSNGVKPPNPAELLLHERFAQLIDHLSKSFDYVLVDTPPSLLVADAAVVGRLAGCSLLVIKSAEHPMREIEESYRRLAQAGVNVRGIVFNQVGRRVGSYGYGGYGYSYNRYYKYG